MENNKKKITDVNGGHIANLTSNIQNTGKDIMDKTDNFEVEKQYAVENLDNFGIMMFGPPRVGKSTMINTLTGRKIAPTSASLDSCTKVVTSYPIDIQIESEDTKEILNKKITFFDTPGIEDWSPSSFSKVISEYMTRCNPICAMIVVSPGSFAPTELLEMFVKTLVERKVFVCLVLTNIYTGSSEQINSCINTLRKIGSQHFGKLKTTQSLLWTYEHGLICGLNAIEYLQEDPFDPKLILARQPPRNVEELIYGLMNGLSRDKLYGWCLTILENRNFFQKFGHLVTGFFSDKFMPLLKKGLNKTMDFFSNLIENIMDN